MSGADPSPAREDRHGVPPALRALIARILRAGTWLSGLLLLAGTGLFLGQGGGDLLTQPVRLHFGGMGGAGAADAGLLLVVAGLLVLVATPLTRVVTSAAVFALARDRAFTFLTLLVFAVLIGTVVVGVLV